LVTRRAPHPEQRPAARPAVRPAALLALLLLAGCANGLAGGLRQSGVVGTPDEFLVLPTRPLEMPSSMAALPPPTPGAPNRVDYQPHQEAIAGLSGRPGVPGNADGSALVASAGPRDPAIRTTLAAEDAEWRQGNHGRLLERLTSKDQETVIYGPMILDPAAAFQALRAAGVAVPAASPQFLDQ
jgi:Protein of unknown function (DUF3035)